ncbi:Y-family DNA polymerase [Prochlorococcus marinus]|uniref:Putative UmuC protein n=1 Tax=Prochlorococcus marinus (strain MIT 9211) TaxID=93059 RepID=A9B9X6_PROM4|nr:Y-family DNA polymerase [Prochlorococcus marinus]ABX08638.1 putative UmuC protein [Prochlorococcus marinus str. MIT 9211]
MSIALIDGNNFYAACEEAIDPKLTGRPLVVLSNNDGCVIARNAKARRLGVLMGAPYFKIRHELNRLDVEVRSSNYALYGDMSHRLMSLLTMHCEDLEIYSIDEAFAKINRPPDQSLHPWARQLRASIYKSLGLPIAIGIGASKSQAKLANYLAKTASHHAGIFDLEKAKSPEACLENIAIENVWGIGRKLARWCRIRGITNAKQFLNMPSNEVRSKFGVTGIRLQNELQGITCLPLSTKPAAKQETCISRSFKRPISTIEELRQAISTYVVKASEKLRMQQQRAGAITVFTRTSAYTPYFYSQAATKRLSVHSNDTSILLANSLDLTKRIFRPHRLLVKAGVIMQDLVDSEHLQLNLLETFNPEKTHQRERLMQTIDNLNKRYGNDTIKWAVCGTNQTWRMHRNHLSPAATTRLTDIPTVKV